MHTVHLMPTNSGMTSGITLCCGKTWAEISGAGGHPTHTKNPNLGMSNDGVWCKGAAMPDTDVLVNPKVACMICGFPRLPDGATHKDGTPIQEGDLLPSSLYIDGKLVKVYCEKHCNGCGQPTDLCWCCTNCHHYPCDCGSTSHPVKKAPKGAVAKTMHVAPYNSLLTLCCKQSKTNIEESPWHDYVEQYVNGSLNQGWTWCMGASKTNLSGDVHGFYFDLPPQYKCHLCNKHMKNCECENGPVNSSGSKLTLDITVDGKNSTVQTSSMVPGWIARGQIPVLKHKDADKAWPNMKPLDHDPVEWAADFYLYHALMSGGVNTKHECSGRCHHNIGQMFAMEDPPVRAEVRIMLDQVIAEADLVFREYIDMACGGELRHHPSVGPKGVLNGNRAQAWAEWRDVRDLVGVRALLDMADLFIDCNNSTGGLCGQRWRQAALLLHKRLTGRVKPEVFVDQVFTLVHNGGVFLNKREWKNNRLGALQGVVLPAQAQDDFPTLLEYASPTAVEIWSDAWKAINYCRIRAGVQPARQEKVRSISVCNECQMASFQGHQRWDCKKANSVSKCKIKTDIEYYRSRKVWPHYDWKFTKCWFYQWDDVSMNGPWYRCSLVGPNYLTAKELLAKTVTIPEGKRTLMISDGDYSIVKLSISKFKGQQWTIRDLIEIHGLKVSILNKQGMEVNT